MPEGYREDLAYIHDVGHGDFARRAAPGVLKLLRSSGVTGGRVVDLGCGSGIWAGELVRAGYEVVGIDQSAALLALARGRAPQADFRHASFLRARLPDCAAVTSLGECFNYLFDTDNDLRRLAALFGRIHQALRPGGVLIFDVAEPGQVTKPNPRRGWREGPDWAVLVEAEEADRPPRLTRRIISFRRVGKLYRRDEEVHRLRLYRGAELARELRRAGFRVRPLRGYGEYRLPPAHVGFLARRP